MEWTNLPTRKEVLKRLQEVWQPAVATKKISVEQAYGRVLSADVLAAHNLPVVRASRMDGVAVDSRMFAGGLPDTSGWREGKEYVRADTGDDFDDAYDSVIAIEAVAFTEEGGLVFEPGLTVAPGMNVSLSGSRMARGELVLPAKTKLTPCDLSVLVAAGVMTVEVYRRPVVAFIPTGSELVPAGSRLQRGQIIDSNTILVRTMLEELGAAPLCLPIVKDDPAAIDRALEAALQRADIVIINGGSSKGKEDYNTRALAQKGNLLCHGIAAAPGKPMSLTVIGGKLAVNLPGPSIGAYYGLEWCIRWAVNQFIRQPMPKRKTVKAVLTEALIGNPGMEFLCKMRLEKTSEGYRTAQVSFRGAHMAETLTAPAQYISKLGLEGHQVGEVLEVELLREEEDEAWLME